MRVDDLDVIAGDHDIADPPCRHRYIQVRQVGDEVGLFCMSCPEEFAPRQKWREGQWVEFALTPTLLSFGRGEESEASAAAASSEAEGLSPEDTELLDALISYARGADPEKLRAEFVALKHRRQSES
jgi:hypothetical protein